MSRDKQIEEMARDMCEYYYEGTCYQDKKPCDCKCDIFTDAQYLYVKGYRKVVEQSETARECEKTVDKRFPSSVTESVTRADLAEEIFAEIEEMVITEKSNDGCAFYLDMVELAELKKKYTEDK